MVQESGMKSLQQISTKDYPHLLLEKAIKKFANP
jgi:hypothetical protein